MGERQWDLRSRDYSPRVDLLELFDQKPAIKISPTLCLGLDAWPLMEKASPSSAGLFNVFWKEAMFWSEVPYHTDAWCVTQMTFTSMSPTGLGENAKPFLKFFFYCTEENITWDIITSRFYRKQFKWWHIYEEKNDSKFLLVQFWKFESSRISLMIVWQVLLRSKPSFQDFQIQKQKHFSLISENQHFEVPYVLY